MALCEAGVSTEEESLRDVFDQAMKLFDTIENGSEATNSDPVQVSCFVSFRDRLVYKSLFCRFKVPI